MGIVDGDTRDEAKQHLENYGDLADAVIRLPDDFAIEAAIVDSLPDKVLRQALRDVAGAGGIAEPDNLDQLSGSQLTSRAISFIKGNSLHGPFIDALPATDFPPQAVHLLTTAVEIAAGTQSGIVQL